MIVQIYEVSCREDLEACLAAGVDHIGVLVGKGGFPRELNPGEASALLKGLPDGVKGCALSLSADAAEIAAVAETEPDILHLGAAPEKLSLTAVHALRRRFPDLPVMRSIPVTGPESLDLAKSYEGAADFLLLDSHDPGDAQIGALGKTHDWSVSRRIVDGVSIPCILAGGLGPDNVAAAINAVSPAGVDSKTRTDRGASHRKDASLVRTFVQNARSSV
ncbi:MAG: phosphoribosylanthranilate isomerase [Alphaproteobacteria bacterium]